MQALELRIPPAITGILVGFAMWWTAHLLPAVRPAGPWRSIVFGACATFGLAVALLGVWTFRRAKTTVHPFHPEAASSLVTSGVYRYTRNPMYVGLASLLFGWAVWLWVPWVFLGPPALMLFLWRFQIIPEERAMSSKFGQDYDDYRKRVPRWL